MASIRAYAAPLPGRGRWAIGLPPTTRRELAGLAWWWTATAAPLRLDLYVSAPLEDDGALHLAVARVLRQAAASAAATPTAAGQAAGQRTPADSAARTRQRLLTVAIAIWGWTLVLGSGGNPLATIGGLWLAIGVPLMRAWYGRAQQRWTGALQEDVGVVCRAERASSRPRRRAGATTSTPPGPHGPGSPLRGSRRRQGGAPRPLASLRPRRPRRPATVLRRAIGCGASPHSHHTGRDTVLVRGRADLGNSAGSRAGSAIIAD